MKKYLLFVFTILVVLFTLTSCDTTPIQKDYHNFELKYDEHSHFDLCECGKKENEEAHYFSDAIIVVSYPTCTTEGIEEYTCVFCKYKEQRTIPALGHKYSDWEVVADPTCITKGQAKRVCTVCGVEEFKDIDYAAHNSTPYTDVTADCTHEGHIGGSYCSICKDELEPSTIIEKTPHAFGEWETTITPDCIHKGQAKRICSNCNYEDYKELDYTDHTPVSYTDEPSTCTKEGHTGGTYCSVCHEELTSKTVLNKTPHNYGDWETTIEADCTHKGQEKRVCQDCGYEDYRDIEIKPHTLVANDEVEATCTHTGLTGGSHCSVCNLEITPSTVVDKTDHNYSDWDTTIAADCTHKGQEKRTCSNCNHEDYRDIDIQPHTSTPYTDIEADCTHEGHIGGTYCSVCNQELTPYTVIDKTAHSFGNWETTIEADCIHKGQEKRVCSVCSHEEYQEVDFGNHTETPYTDVAATCEHEGHTGGTYCSVCHETLTPYTVIGKTAHTYGEWITTQPATCISQGQAKRECEVCGHTDYKYLDMIEHTPTPGTAKASTCIAHGHTEGSYCSFCNAELEAPTELPLSDHNYSIETVTKEATLTSDGVLTHTCSVCGDSYTTKIDRLPITWNIWYKSLRSDTFTNKYLEMYYEDHVYHHTLDITIAKKDLLTYAKIYDYDTGKEHEYYCVGDEVVETNINGYRHRRYDDYYDPFIQYFGIIVENGIYFSADAYDDVEWQEDGKYYLAQNINIRNHRGDEENATVAIKINDASQCEMYAYSSDNYVINITKISDCPSITMPKATHHHVIDGKCEYCKKEFTTYTYKTPNNYYTFNFNIDNLTNELDYEYSVNYVNVNDINILTPTYYDNGTIKRITTLYYSGSSPKISKTVKSYTVDSNYVLTVTYTDYSTDRIQLLNDDTAIQVSSSAPSSMHFEGNYIGKSFDVVLSNKTIRYYIKSETELEVSEYKEVDLYVMNNKVYTDLHSRILDKLFGQLRISTSDGKKHDGSNGTIYFKLNSNLSLDIYYDGLGMSPFSVITFQNITGTYTNNIEDYYIYFMADNENYVLHYNGNIEITKQ